MKLTSIIKVLKLSITNKNFVVNRGMVVSASKNEEVISYTFGSYDSKNGQVTITSTLGSNE